MEKLKPLYTAGGIVKWCSCFGKQRLAVPLIVQHRVTSMTQQFSREMKTCPHRNLYRNVHTAVLFIMTKQGKTPKCASTDEWINKTRYIHTTEYYSTIKKRIKYWYRLQHKCWEHYDLKRQTQKTSIEWFIWNLHEMSKTGKFRHRK